MRVDHSEIYRVKKIISCVIWKRDRYYSVLAFLIRLLTESVFLNTKQVHVLGTWSSYLVET